MNFLARLTVALAAGLSLAALSWNALAEDAPHAATGAGARPAATTQPAEHRILGPMHRLAASPGNPGNPGGGPGNMEEHPGALPGPLPGARGDRPRPAERELSPEQLRAAVDILKEQNPELARRVEDAMRSQPERVRELMANQWPRLARLVEMRSRDPKLYALVMDELRFTRQAREQARLIVKTDSPGVAEPLRRKLRELVGKLEDTRLQMRRHEITLLEKRIADIRKDIEAWDKNHDQLIQTRMDEILDSVSEKAGDKPGDKTGNKPAERP